MPIILDDITAPGRRTFLEMQEEVLAYGFSASRYRSRVKNWLNEGVHRIRRRAKIAEAEEPQAITTEAGVAGYSLPAASVRVRSLREPSSSAALEAISLGQLDEISSTATGKPSVYALEGDTILLRPIPDAAYMLELRYWSNSDKMIEDSDIPGVPDDYLDVVYAYALSEAFAAEQDIEMAQFHRTAFDVKLAELMGDLQKRQTDHVRQVPGMFATRRYSGPVRP